MSASFANTICVSALFLAFNSLHSIDFSDSDATEYNFEENEYSEYIDEYIIDTSSYGEKINEIIGVYVLYEIPNKIANDIKHSNKIIKHYFKILENPNLNVKKIRNRLPKPEYNRSTLNTKLQHILNTDLRSGEYKTYYNTFPNDLRSFENKLRSNGLFDITNQKLLSLTIKSLEQHLNSLNRRFNAQNNYKGNSMHNKISITILKPLKLLRDQYNKLLKYEQTIEGAKQFFESISVRPNTKDLISNN